MQRIGSIESRGFLGCSIFKSSTCGEAGGAEESITTTGTGRARFLAAVFLILVLSIVFFLLFMGIVSLHIIANFLVFVLWTNIEGNLIKKDPEKRR